MLYKHNLGRHYERHTEHLDRFGCPLCEEDEQRTYSTDSNYRTHYKLKHNGRKSKKVPKPKILEDERNPRYMPDLRPKKNKHIATTEPSNETGVTQVAIKDPLELVDPVTGELVPLSEIIEEAISDIEMTPPATPEIAFVDVGMNE